MKSLITLLFVFFAVGAGAKNRPLKERVDEFSKKYPTPAKIEKRFKEWTKEEPKNADPYVLAANAYLHCASGVSVNSSTKGELMVVDPKTKKQVGSISETVNQDLVRKALDTLIAGAQKFPSRLDIHVGCLATAERLNDVAAILKAGETMVKTVADQPEKMRWVDGEPLGMPAVERMVNELHPRIGNLYRREQDDSDLAASKLSVAALKLAPKDVRLINDAAIFHAYKQQWDKALEYFLQAEKVEPNDLLVQHNIAQATFKLGRVEEARKIWKAILAKAPAGSEDAQAAEAALKGLDAPAK